jgi:DNA repair protein RadD
MKLRPYQQKLESDVYAFWNSTGGPSNAGVVAATGSGKTVLFCKFLRDAQGYRVAMAHRQELVGQMSVTLARNGVRHRVLAPDNVRRTIVQQQIVEVGTSHYDPQAKCICAGVGTMTGLRKRGQVESWMAQTSLAVVDEAHHVTRENSFGQSLLMLPNAYGLLPTATPSRADGLGLGRHADGLMDVLLLAPEMRDIINMGYLTDYRIVIAESDVRMGEDDVSATTGEFNMHKLREAHHASRRIVGDVVRAYLQYARGKLGLTFAVDVEEATKIAAEFRAQGVKAEVVSGTTPDALRTEIIRKFKRREVLQLVSVDIFGEGFDLPALEVVSFARHTNSFSLYAQQFGRALRLMLEQYLAARWDTYTDAERRAAIAASKKPRAIIIDHVGNVLRHMGPPDARWRAGKWTLDRRDKRASTPSDAEPLRGCPNPDPHALGRDQPCNQPYERFRVSCPYCGHIPIPAERSTPEQVEGDMTMLSDEAVAQMRDGISFRLESPVTYPYGASPEIKGRLDRVRRERTSSVEALKNAAAWWGGLCASQGYSDGEAYKKFYLKFGIDVWSMQMLDRAEAEALHARIIAELAKHNVDGTVNANISLTHH